VSSEETRFLKQNLKNAYERMVDLIAQSLAPRKARLSFKISHTQKKAQLKIKQRRKNIKTTRRRIAHIQE
jgi:hypothetical protein